MKFIFFVIFILLGACSESGSRQLNTDTSPDDSLGICNQSLPSNPRVNMGLVFDDTDRRALLGGGVRYTLNTSGQRLSSLTGNVNFVITIPSNMTLQTFSISVPNGSVAISGSKGETITWSLPVENVGDSMTFEVNIDDPSNSCISGGTLEVSASVNSDLFVCQDTTTPLSTLITSAATSSRLLINDNPDEGSNLHSFNINDTPLNSSGYETGLASVDNIKDAGEGEFIDLQAVLEIPGGNWSDLDFVDDLGTTDSAAGFSVVSSQISWSVGGSNGVLPVTIGGSGFTVNLSPIGTALGSSDATGQTVTFDYQVSVTDQTVSRREFIQRTSLIINNLGAGNGNCGDGTSNYTSGDFVILERADARINIDTPNNVIEGIPFNVTLTIDNIRNFQSYDLEFGLNLSGNYTFDNLSAPIYGGYFSSTAPVQPDTNQPRFTLSNLPAGSSGTITLRLTKNLGASGNLAIDGDINFNSEQTRISSPGVAVYTNNDSDTPGTLDNCGQSNNFCLMFQSTNPLPNGDIDTNDNNNPIEEADNICNTDPNKPNSNQYKALIVSDGNRQACLSALCVDDGVNEHIDWPLENTTEYRRVDRLTVLGVTNSLGIFDTNLSNTIASNQIWTGLQTDWTNAALSGNCQNWSSNLGTDTGIGGSSQLDIRAFSDGLRPCSDSNQYLICVEQP